MNSCEENKSGVKRSNEMSCFCKQDFFQWGKISSTQVLPRDLDVSADFKTEQMFCKCDSPAVWSHLVMLVLGFLGACDCSSSYSLAFLHEAMSSKFGSNISSRMSPLKVNISFQTDVLVDISILSAGTNKEAESIT